MICRDWPSTLFPASYKGVPFKVERDDEGGGRRLVVHQFPMRDEPFIEDLGEDKRPFEVTAYLASDTADLEATALLAMSRTRGEGILVLPMQGPIIAHCESAKRSHERDKMGFVAFEMKFIRAGAKGALATVASLIQRVFDAAGRIAGLVGAVLAVATVTRGLVSSVSASAIGSARLATASLEAIRSDAPVDPAVSATTRDALGGLYDTAGLAFSHRAPDAAATAAILSTTRGQAVASLAAAPDMVGGWGAALVETARAIADGLGPGDAARYFRDLLALPLDDASGGSTPTRRTMAANEIAIARALRIAAVTVLAEAAVRRDYGSRQEAIAARAEVAELIEREQVGLAGAATADLYVALEDLRGIVVAQLSRRILDLAPVVSVEARVSMPSLWWAWRIHKDPLRASELVARNAVPAPALMPLSFEALSDQGALR